MTPRAPTSRNSYSVIDDAVVITGLGTVSPYGTDVRSLWQAIASDGLPPRPDARIPYAIPHRHTHAVPADAGAGQTAFEFAHHAARQAIRESGIEPTRRIGVVVGNAMGDHPWERAADPDRPPPAYAFELATRLAETLGCVGPVRTVSTACSAGLYAISMAVDLLADGEADACVVGGSEAVSRVALGCFNRLHAVDPVCCRPFDRRRAGTVMGEGAAMFVLETRRSWSERRGPRPYAVVAGTGWSCDGHHLTIPAPDGTEAVRAARDALAMAGLDPEAVDCVLAHGTATPQNDAVESQVIGGVIGRHVPVCGVKGHLGHSGGAAGAFQCLVAALMLRHGLIPPTANFGEPACECPLEVSARPRPADVRHVLLNSYAFGGNNISVVLDRFEL